MAALARASLGLLRLVLFTVWKTRAQVVPAYRAMLKLQGNQDPPLEVRSSAERLNRAA
jgi:hypothetical protein